VEVDLIEEGEFFYKGLISLGKEVDFLRLGAELACVGVENSCWDSY